MRPVVIVAGLGRCGSSMVMQMLAAGGIPCVGAAPAYEDERTNTRLDPTWYASLAGHAVKLLDPHRLHIPMEPKAVAIRLERRSVEQAASMVKFLRSLGYPIGTSSRDRRRVIQSIENDTAKARAALIARGIPRITLQFEEILARPREAANAIAALLQPHFPGLDLDAMAAAVRQRPPHCMPDMDTEISLAKEATA